MSDFDPVAAVAAYHAAINALDFAAIEGWFAEDAVYLSAGTGDVSGRAAILASFRAYFAEYPDQRAGDDRIEALGPLAARAFWWLRATRASTGAALERRGEEVVTFNAAGKIQRVEVREAQPA